jgi:hypothetical protein
LLCKWADSVEGCEGGQHMFVCFSMPYQKVVVVVSLAGPSGRAVGGVGLDRLDCEIVGSNPLKAWMFVLVFPCCVVLCG